MDSKQYCPDEHYANRITGIYKRGLTPLTKNLDPERHFVYQNREQITYRPAASLPLAEVLLKIGSGDTIDEAVAIINAVFFFMRCTGLNIQEDITISHKDS